jgi:hypothetical protein
MKIVTKGNKTTKVFDAEVVSRAKLRIDSRKAYLKAYRPERWGDQSTLTVNNNDGIDIANMSQEELKNKLAEFDTKRDNSEESKVA